MPGRKTATSFPQVIHVLLALSLCLNLFFLISPGSSKGEAEPVLSLQELGEIREPGTYGPSDAEMVEGSLTISAPGVRLQNTRVTGDLILAAAIGEGCADICRVTVEERALVQGGGEDTVVFEDSFINHLVIEKEKGKVRVVLRGDTTVEKITILGEACLQAAELSGAGLVKEVSIETAAEIELEGDFDLVSVAEKEAGVTLLAGEVGRLTTTGEAGGALITLLEGVVVKLLEPGAPLEIAGGGMVKEVTVTSAGLSKFAGKVERITAGGRGIFLEFGKGRTESLLVSASEGKVMIHLAPGAVLGYAELNGAAGITGEGAIERVRINAAGTTIEQNPGSVELAEGIRAKVAGKEMAVKKEEPAPAPAPAPTTPSTPTISIDAFRDRVMGPGESETISFRATAGAALSVSSSNTGVVTASLSGTKLKIKAGNVQGSATITLKGTKAGHNSCTSTFKVTMDPVIFKVGDKLPTFDKLTVAVKLKYDDPEKYKVTVGGTRLDYMGNGEFYGTVPAGDAYKGNVKVVRK